jgi:hypothetical protein
VGYTSALDMAQQTDLDTALTWHLRSNHLMLNAIQAQKAMEEIERIHDACKHSDGSYDGPLALGSETLLKLALRTLVVWLGREAREIQPGGRDFDLKTDVLWDIIEDTERLLRPLRNAISRQRFLNAMEKRDTSSGEV